MGAYEYQGTKAVITVSAPTVTQPTCTVLTGEIIVNATTTTGTLEYSIDNGSSYQSSNTFSGLADGNYTISVIEQGSSCTETYGSNPVVINTLVITVSTPTVTQPTCTSTGEIIVNATTTTGTLEYSIDNGSSYQSSNTFSGLADGNYTISVREQGSSCTETYGSNPVVINVPPYSYSTAIYVNHNATGNNDGSSWTDAYTNLQDAIDNQCDGFDIWVAAGTYLPTDAPDGTSSTGLTDRNNAFHLHTDMKIYGGFAGTETQLSQRDAAINITILSGDFNNDDGVTGSGSTFAITGNTQNAYHIMITANLTVAAVIDGFTIKGGNADGSGSISYQLKIYNNGDGGGMFNESSSPTLTNTTFLYNTASVNGGGMYNEYSSDPSDPIIGNTTFLYNTAGVSGGGMYNSFSSPTLTNTTFLYNTASVNGGGMYNYYYSSPTLTNTTFSYNTASNEGGGMFNFFFSDPIIGNTTFLYNTASSSGGGMYNDESSPIITNTIFWENLKNGSNGLSGADIENNNSSSPTVSYCLTQENSIYNGANNGINNNGTGIINNQDPLFVDAPNGDFSLQGCSPAINAGIAVSHVTDISGNPHVGIVDMGAYEFKELDPITITANITHGTNPNYSGVPSITSEGAILNTNKAVFKARNYIELKPGFLVVPAGGAATVFRAEIGGCE